MSRDDVHAMVVAASSGDGSDPVRRRPSAGLPVDTLTVPAGLA